MPFVKKHPYLSGSVAIVIIVIGIIIFSRSRNNIQTITVNRADYINRVTVAGKVVAAKTADLGFAESGRIVAIYTEVGQSVKAGTTLASIESGTARADLEQKQATLDKERAALAALERGTRGEELAASQQSYDDASSALLIAIKSAYTETEGAILTKTDTLFTNGNTINPEINIRTQGSIEKRAIENDRLVLNEQLAKWKNMISTQISAEDNDALMKVRSLGIETMAIAKKFIDKLAMIAGNMTPANSGFDQTEIDADRSTINSADAQASAAAAAEQSAYAAWTTASRSLTLKQAGATKEDVAAQVAQVASAAASVASAQAALRTKIIVAPFDGVIARVDGKIGEISVPGQQPISIMSSGTFEIESYVPEVYISRVKIDDPAEITLDAYGSDTVFHASVISIDPAETIKDGVSTYKTRLRFAEATSSARILSGMTATIVITTDFIADTIMIPRSIIHTIDNMHTVSVLRNGANVDVPIELGVVGPLGQTQVLSGLSTGDMIVVSTE